MLLVGFATSPHETKVQIICISKDNYNNKNETRVYIYEFENATLFLQNQMLLDVEDSDLLGCYAQ
jgi:hypothetical protein